MMKKLILNMAAVALVLALSLPVGAASYPFNIDQLGPEGSINNDFLDPASVSLFSGTLAGPYNLIYLGYEAGHTDWLTSGMIIPPSSLGAATLVMQNQVASDQVWDGTYSMGNLYFSDTNDGPANLAANTPSSSSSGGVQIWELTQDWLIPSTGSPDYQALGGLQLLSGDYIIGFGDGQGDADFDDLILAARAVPIPGAVWLLGSGLLGLIGVRRFKRG